MTLIRAFEGRRRRLQQYSLLQRYGIRVLHSHGSRYLWGLLVICILLIQRQRNVYFVTDSLSTIDTDINTAIIDPVLMSDNTKESSPVDADVDADINGGSSAETTVDTSKSMSSHSSTSITSPSGSKSLLDNDTLGDMNTYINNANDESNAITSFPPECTWQCYLRNNPDLIQNGIPWDEKAATEHYIEHGQGDEQGQRRCSCQIILLAGPHKAASTTLQSISVVYSEMENVPWKWLLPPSKYPYDYAVKGFSSFVFKFYSMYNEKTNSQSWIQRHMQSQSQSEIVEFEEYKIEMKKEVDKIYNEGYNMIFGTEEIDEITHPKFNDTLIEEILSILPRPTTKAMGNEDRYQREQQDEYPYLTAVVVYRAPRVDHLKSLWKQVLAHENNNETITFHEFLCGHSSGSSNTSSDHDHNNDDSYLHQHFQRIDSLLLTQLLLKKGLKVKLIDMSGVSSSSNGVDFYSVLGCDLMGLPCHTNDNNQTIPLPITQHEEYDKIMSIITKQQNKREDGVFDISVHQRKQIDTVLRHYDCSQKSLLLETKNNNKFDILYGDMLLKNLKECDDDTNNPNFGLPPPTRNEAIKSIRQVLNC